MRVYRHTCTDCNGSIDLLDKTSELEMCPFCESDGIEFDGVAGCVRSPRTGPAWDIESGDGAILYRVEGHPVGGASTDIPERVSDALESEFDEPLKVEERE